MIKKKKRLNYYEIRYKKQKPKRFKLFKLNATFSLIAINTLAYFVILILMLFPSNKSMIYNIALQPLAILHGQKLWTIITSMFMHGSFFHLFVNMLSLFFLGSFLERLIGKKRFLLIYFISGIIASLFFIFLALAFNQDLSTFAVGSSGAIFGLGGVLAVLTPRVPVYIMFIPIAMPLWFGIILILVILWLVSAAAGLPIGNTAHLGGLIAGVVYGFYLRFKYKEKIALFDKYFRFRR